MKSSPRIQIIVERPDGHRSDAEIEGAKVTSDMLDSAEDLLHTLTTGERPVLKNLYEVTSRAFGTTREDAKERIIAATYGMSTQRIEEKSRSRDQVLGNLIAARRARNTAHASVSSWMKEKHDNGEPCSNFDAPGWATYTRAETTYDVALQCFDAWLDGAESKMTALDRRRIADGDRALALPDPKTPDEIRMQLEVIHDGMLALQSLDDLGEEGNRAAHENLRTLEKRYEALQGRLKDTKASGKKR